MVVSLARASLALIVLSAGVLKLVSMGSVRDTLAGFGVAPRTARWLGPVLPLAELLWGALLLWPATAWIGAVGALALLGESMSRVRHDLEQVIG